MTADELHEYSWMRATGELFFHWIETDILHVCLGYPPWQYSDHVNPVLEKP